MKSSEKSLNWRHKAEYALFVTLRKLARASSPLLLKGIHWMLYGLTYHLLRICRQVVQTNLNLAFSQSSALEKQKIAQGSYHWLIQLGLDALRLDTQNQPLRQTIRFENLSVLEEALAEKKGVLLVSGHFGNWEAIAPVLAEQGYSPCVYVGRQSNPLVDTHYNQIRHHFGITTIERSKTAALQLGKLLGENRIVCMLVDQNDRQSNLFVNFFGVPASMSKGVGMYHLLKQSPIVFVHCAYGTPPQLHMKFQRVRYQRVEQKEQNLLQVSQAITNALEEAIRQAPEQYFWMHRRWRSRPPGESAGNLYGSTIRATH